MSHVQRADQAADGAPQLVRGICHDLAHQLVPGLVCDQQLLEAQAVQHHLVQRRLGRVRRHLPCPLHELVVRQGTPEEGSDGGVVLDGEDGVAGLGPAGRVARAGRAGLGG